MTAPSSWRALARYTMIIGVVIFGAVTLRDLHLSRFVAALAEVDTQALALAVAINGVVWLLKGVSWWILMRPQHRVGLLRLCRYSLAAFGLSVVMPLRAGEALRIGMLARVEQVPASYAVGVALAEKWLHALTLVMWAALLPLYSPTLPSWARHAIVTASSAAATLTIALLALARPLRARLPRLLSQPLAWLTTEPTRLASATLTLFSLWFVDCLLVMASGRAVHLPLSFFDALFVLIVLNLAIAIPSTPAQLGVLELGAVTALDALGVARERALAFAVFYHAVQIVPLLGATLLDARFIARGLRAIRTRTA